MPKQYFTAGALLPHAEDAAKPLSVPPTEIEVAQLLEALKPVPELHDIARRLAFQRDCLLSGGRMEG